MINKGMCPPMEDREYFTLVTDNGTKFVEEILKYYPELKEFIKVIRE